MRTSLPDRLHAAISRRAPLLRGGDVDALRLVNGAGDGVPGLYVDRLGAIRFLSVEEESAAARGEEMNALLEALLASQAPEAVFHRVLRRAVRERKREELEPKLLHSADAAAAARDEWPVLERGLRFLVRPREGYSYGLFLDQRDNRARVRELARGGRVRSVLNLFAYTCSFSVAAAIGGASTTSVDLSARYLDWARANFAANAIDSRAHELARGDALTFLEIARKRGRRFDLAILDPPTFATSKQSGVFQVERHFARLVELAASVTSPGGLLLASHNRRAFTRAALEKKIRDGVRAAGRRIARLAPLQPPCDFSGPETGNPAARGCWIELG